MIEVWTMTAEHPRWEEVASFAENCSWRAGAELARLMREGAFPGWERVFAAAVDGRIAGFCTFTASDELPPERGLSPFIGFVFVGEGYRGQRLSGRMIEAVVEYARGCGFAQVYVMSGEEGLYEKYGFTPLGWEKTIYGTTDRLFARPVSPEKGTA